MRTLLFGSILTLLFCVSCAPKKVAPDSRPMLEQGLALAEAGRHAEAVQAFDHALALQPDHVPSLRARAQSHMLRGDFLRAEQDYARLMVLEPSEVWNVGQRGLARSLSGNHTGAVEDFTAVLGVKPENEVALLNRGYSLLEQGNPQRAVQDFSRVIERNPENLAALYYLARSLTGVSRFGQAANAYARIFELEPEGAKAGAEILLGSEPGALEGFIRQARSERDQGRTLAVLDCIARRAMGKDILACSVMRP